MHTDQLDRPVMMTDDAKNVVWKATYLPFGEVYAVIGSGRDWVQSVQTGSAPRGSYAYDDLSHMVSRSLPVNLATLHYVHHLSGNIIAEDGSGNA